MLIMSHTSDEVRLSSAMLQNLILYQINICAMHNSKQFIKHIKNNATPVSCVIHGVQTVMTTTTPKHVKNISRGQATAFRSKILSSDCRPFFDQHRGPFGDIFTTYCHGRNG